MSKYDQLSVLVLTLERLQNQISLCLLVYSTLDKNYK